MKVQLILAFFISLLHGFIPSHWLPIASLAHKMKWNKFTTYRYASMAAWAHSIGTILIGLIIYFVTNGCLTKFKNGSKTSDHFLLNIQFEKIGGIILVLLGIWFLYRHYKHHHFHLDPVNSGKHKWIFGAILLSMFLSPCMEIVGYFFTLAPSGFSTIISLILVYTLSTWISILTGVFIGYSGMKKLNAHKWEHNSGIITSAVIILSGILLYFGILDIGIDQFALPK